MIKNLKSKLIICLFLLVTVFSVTSSCFATITDITETCDTPFTLDDVYNEVSSFGFTKDNSVVLVIYQSYSDGSSSYNIWVFSTSTGISYIKEGWANHTSGKSFDELNKGISCNYYTFFYRNNSFSHENSLSGTTGTFVGMGSGDYPPKVGDISTITLKNYSGTVIFEPNQISVDVTHEFQSDTSAKINFTLNNVPIGSVLKYSLTGVELNTDLTAPLQLRNPITYTPRSKQLSC